MTKTKNKRKKAKVISQLALAEKKYLFPAGVGRPRRRLIMVNGESGLCCIQCGKVKTLKDFGFSHRKCLYFESMCRECKRQYHRDRRKKGLGWEQI